MKIFVEEDEDALEFSESFYKKRMHKYPALCSGITTNQIKEFVEDYNSLYILPDGQTSFAPTGEKYRTIRIQADSIEKVERALLYLIATYIRQQIKLGKKYLYWRQRPMLYHYQEHNEETKEYGDYYWTGMCRLIMSDRKILPI